MTNATALKHKIPDDKPDKPWPCAFIAGGFLFAKGEIINTTPADPNIYFDGEEISLAARLWTRGHNIYSPNQQILYHLYKTKDDNDKSTSHWMDHSHWHKLNRRSLVRVHALLNNLENAPSTIRQQPGDLDDLETYGLGTSRSIEDYFNYAGINFKEKPYQKRPMQAFFQQISRNFMKWSKPGNYNQDPNKFSQPQQKQKYIRVEGSPSCATTIALD